MKKMILTALSLILISGLKAQDCEGYFPVKTRLRKQLR